MAGGVCACTRARAVSLWPEMGAGGCGVKAPSQGLCQNGHGLPLLPECAPVFSGCPAGMGAEVFGLAESPGPEWWARRETLRMEGQ